MGLLDEVDLQGCLAFCNTTWLQRVLFARPLRCCPGVVTTLLGDYDGETSFE